MPARTRGLTEHGSRVAQFASWETRAPEGCAEVVSLSAPDSARCSFFVAWSRRKSSHNARLIGLRSRPSALSAPRRATAPSMNEATSPSCMRGRPSGRCSDWPKRSRRQDTNPGEARRGLLGRASGLAAAPSRAAPRRAAGYACQVRSDRAPSGFKLVEVTEPGILASLARIDAMSDEEIRELASGEPPTIVDAAEGIIADRHKGRSGAKQSS